MEGHAAGDSERRARVAIDEVQALARQTAVNMM
jgi:hypothetical protein